MTNQEIIDLFDSTNITLTELSALTGKPVSYLKTLLMGEK
jgi:predicted HTH domain antitoxin